MIEQLSACACLGPQFNEPKCPCAMRREGLPSSPERLAHNAYWTSPEGLELSAKNLEQFKRIFDAKH